MQLIGYMLIIKKFLFEASSVCDAFPHVTLGGDWRNNGRIPSGNGP